MSLHYEHVQTKIGFGKDKTEKYVGKRRLADPFDISRLTKEVSHITGQREAHVLITLQFLTQAIEDAIKDGRSIDLGFGTLSPAISTKAADEADKVKIVRKRVLFRASKELREIAQKMSVKHHRRRRRHHRHRRRREHRQLQQLRRRRQRRRRYDQPTLRRRR